MRRLILSLVELIGFAGIAVSVGGNFGIFWGIGTAGLLLAIWAGAEDLRRAE